MKQASTYGFWYGFNITAVILVPCFLFLVPLLHAFEQFVQTVDFTLEQTEQASIQQPTSLALSLDNSSSTPLNAVAFKIQYDPKALSITSINPTGVLCEDRFILENNINQASGTASFACGTITPFTNKTGTIALLEIIPHTSGTSSIFFISSSTQVLAHDGLGTDVTRERKNLIFSTL